ncbi:deoxycytidylate deaminase-like [Trichomycterus rosablanca]|uniref:deoxycytidylate deaminase-like n=1 Tax=Trichomycterus rosablanca TaxID=2290929 RepID=UPI002F35D184
MESKQQNLSAGPGTVKRTDYLNWDDYFMAVACLSAQRSKDPEMQESVGACIVNEYKRIVGTGYNGMPDNCHDNFLSWAGREEKDNKHLYVCHAELNAIVNKISADVRGCTMFVTRFPCNECTKLLIQSGIKHVIYLAEKKPEPASRKMMDLAKVSYE